jgi:succinate dehydrogenase / fumarate reductase cytochrome b subunit
MAGNAPETAPHSGRPLSPHLQVYRWPITMLTSILHRMTGVANVGGMLLVTFWLVAMAMGPDTYAFAQEVLGSLIGQIILAGFTLSVVYHLLNGIRHLAWDSGWGFELGTSRMTGYLVFLGTVALSLCIWIAAYWMEGAFGP